MNSEKCVSFFKMIRKNRYDKIRRNSFFLNFPRQNNEETDFSYLFGNVIQYFVHFKKDISTNGLIIVDLISCSPKYGKEVLEFFNQSIIEALVFCFMKSNEAMNVGVLIMFYFLIQQDLNNSASISHRFFEVLNKHNVNNEYLNQILNGFIDISANTTKSSNIINFFQIIDEIIVLYENVYSPRTFQYYILYEFLDSLMICVSQKKEIINGIKRIFFKQPLLLLSLKKNRIFDMDLFHIPIFQNIDTMEDSSRYIIEYSQYVKQIIDFLVLINTDSKDSLMIVSTGIKIFDSIIASHAIKDLFLLILFHLLNDNDLLFLFNSLRDYIVDGSDNFIRELCVSLLIISIDHCFDPSCYLLLNRNRKTFIDFFIICKSLLPNIPIKDKLICILDVLNDSHSHSSIRSQIWCQIINSDKNDIKLQKNMYRYLFMDDNREYIVLPIISHIIKQIDQTCVNNFFILETISVIVELFWSTIDIPLISSWIRHILYLSITHISFNEMEIFISHNMVPLYYSGLISIIDGINIFGFKSEMSHENIFDVIIRSINTNIYQVMQQIELLFSRPQMQIEQYSNLLTESIRYGCQLNPIAMCFMIIIVTLYYSHICDNDEFTNDIVKNMCGFIEKGSISPKQTVFVLCSIFYTKKSEQDRLSLFKSVIGIASLAYESNDVKFCISMINCMLETISPNSQIDLSLMPVHYETINFFCSLKNDSRVILPSCSYAASEIDTDSFSTKYLELIENKKWISFFSFPQKYFNTERAIHTSESIHKMIFY